MCCAQGYREIFLSEDGSRTAFKRRPGLTPFLERCAELFEVVVFTAGSQVSILEYSPLVMLNCRLL